MRFSQDPVLGGTGALFLVVITISTVIFKLRVISPRSRDAPARNQAHMEYIGRRRGIVSNDGVKHGLFGVVDGRPAENVQNLQELSHHIAKKTRDDTIAYRAIISLRETDAVQLGFDERENWQELVARKLPDIADKIGISVQNLEYAAAVHMDKSHPHCHIIFWDKDQGVKKPYVHKVVSDKIRVDLIKHVFSEEMSELHNIKNEARKAALENAGGFFDGFLDAFADMTPREYSAAVENLKRESDLADGSLIYSRFPAAAMNALAADLFRLTELVPKTGRLNMKFMPPELKTEIERFVEKLLDLNDDCDREFKRYVNSAVELCKYYTGTPESHAKLGALDQLGQITFAVHKAPDFHHIVYNHIKYSVIFDADTVIRAFPVLNGVVRLKRQRV